MSLLSLRTESIVDRIGNTPIVPLKKLAKACHANVFVKCEFMNPGGSVKDRPALHIINEGERSGRLKPGGTIVEATSGNTGLGLAMISAVRGYKCIFVMADKQSEEKRRMLRAAGAEIVICPTDVDADDPRSYYKVAARIVAETPDAFYSNQYHNPANIEAHYLYTGPEIWRQCGADLDVFICSIGTGGTVTGISRYLREKNPKIKIVGVDPVGSIYFELFHTGKAPTPHGYLVEGIGEDFMPSTMDLRCMDDIIQVGDHESFVMARRLMKEEGLFAGASSGSAVAGTIKYLSEQKNQEKKPNVLVLLPDSCSRYLGKHLNDDWLKEKKLWPC
jgi:cystathionine beta-synthase